MERGLENLTWQFSVATLTLKARSHSEHAKTQTHQQRHVNAVECSIQSNAQTQRRPYLPVPVATLPRLSSLTLLPLPHIRDLVQLNLLRELVTQRRQIADQVLARRQ